MGASAIGSARALPPVSSSASCRWGVPRAASLRPGLRRFLWRFNERRGGRHQRPMAALGPAAAPAAVRGFWPVLVQAWQVNPTAVFLGISALLLSISLSAFLVAAIPALLAMRHSARAFEKLADTLEQEVPDTAAALRLTGMELNDCIEEVALLSADLTQGIRTTARSVTDVQDGIRGSVELAGSSITHHVIPALKKQVPQTRDKVQSLLEERAHLGHSAALFSQVAQATGTTARRLRVALAAASLASGAGQSIQRLRGNTDQHAGA